MVLYDNIDESLERKGIGHVVWMGWSLMDLEAQRKRWATGPGSVNLGWMVTCGLSKSSSTLSGKSQEGGSSSGGGQAQKKKTPVAGIPNPPCGYGHFVGGKFLTHTRTHDHLWP